MQENGAGLRLGATTPVRAVGAVLNLYCATGDQEGLTKITKSVR